METATPMNRRKRFEQMARRAINKANVDAGNARWWPKYYGMYMYLRPRTVPLSKIKGLRLYQEQILTRAQCQELKARILSLRSNWTAYPEEAIFRLGTPTCTLKGVNDDVINRSNALLLAEFSSLYDTVFQELSRTLGTDQICFKANAYLPGFAISHCAPGAPPSPATPLIGRLRDLFYTHVPTAPFHHDGQYDLLEWDAGVRSCPKISFILPIDLPIGGSKLYVFNATDKVSARRAIVSERSYVQYEVGKIVIHDGDHWHMVAPSKMVPDDYKIVLVGHGVQLNGTWYLYW